jgi:hypothetical protein
VCENFVHQLRGSPVEHRQVCNLDERGHDNYTIRHAPYAHNMASCVLVERHQAVLLSDLLAKSFG